MGWGSGGGRGWGGVAEGCTGEAGGGRCTGEVKNSSGLGQWRGGGGEWQRGVQVRQVVAGVQGR